MATGNADGDCCEQTRYLFPKDRLTSLSKWSEISAKLAAGNLQARPLKLDDHERGYLELLEQLTVVGHVTKAQFVERFNEMARVNEAREHYLVVVIEDLETCKVVGCSTLFLECKFIHECAMRGRLEDVAVLDTHRGRKIGQLVVSLIVELAREAYKCYKITLDCKDELFKFYSKIRFTRACNMLEIRF